MRVRKHSRCRPVPNDAGASAVELALILPLLMMLLFGLISFGRAFTLKIQLTGAAREGARTMAIKKNVGEAKTRTKEHAPLAALADGEIQVSTPTSTTTCPPNERVTVVVTRSFTYDFILFEIGPRDLIGRAVMRCGG